MLVDLHMHEKTHSPDSFLALTDMVSIAQGLGLNGICITDHDSMGLRAKAEAYAKRIGFPIFVGVEFFSLQGDFIAFGIDKVPERRIDAQDFINYVKAQGGVCFAAHPFRQNGRGAGRGLAKLRGLDAIEAFNGSTPLELNLEALKYCDQMGIQPVGVSDCHVPEKVGVYATHLPDDVTTLPGFIHSFQKGLCYPVGLIGGQYVNLIDAAAMFVPETCLNTVGTAWAPAHSSQSA
ncbi:MAG: PHP domain-containing protein [Oscillospiraceae bacterium]|jgi:predicted metal-dependent phosphoesterase TrpH